MAEKTSGEQTRKPTKSTELSPMTREDDGRGNPAGAHVTQPDANAVGVGVFGSRERLGGPNGPAMKVAASLIHADDTLTSDAALWAAIRNRTDAIRGDRYGKFINRVLCEPDGKVGKPACDLDGKGGKSYERPRAQRNIGAAIEARRDELLATSSGYGVDAYNLLKLATQAFLLLEAGIVIARARDVDGNESPQEEIDLLQDQADLRAYLYQTLSGGLPYLDRIVDALDLEDLTVGSPFCKGTLTYRFSCPSMLELIWSYWHEEGMLVQTMNAICMRFQNRRGPFERDPLANLEINPLRPLNNLLWGYIQDEYNRLTVPRRAYEYDHHYGLKLMGKAVPELRSADSRSKFIEAFHNLLYRTAAFYREDADTTVIADGFALLSSLREVHLLLAEGAHNQFGDLPWTSRVEMLMIQWFLGRAEMREFLRGRAMVPYSERWMGQVDTMKKLQGWTDTSITQFRNLGVYGEQILLSIRYGDWSEINDQENAKTWARSWRPEIQGYIHAYMAATGVDLSEDIVDFRTAPARYAQPSILLEERIAAQGSPLELPCAPASRSLTTGGAGFGALPGQRRRALNPFRK